MQINIDIVQADILLKVINGEPINSQEQRELIPVEGQLLTYFAKAQLALSKPDKFSLW